MSYCVLIDMQATREHIIYGVKRLEQECPKDVDLSFVMNSYFKMVYYELFY